MKLLPADMHDCDFTLGYSGGSGGFFIFHQILNSGHHWCSFRDYADRYDNYSDFYADFTKVKQSNWNVGEKWKESERLPHNLGTARNSISNKNKIFKVCNPGDIRFTRGQIQWEEPNNLINRITEVAVYLYTNIELHAHLQVFKKANHRYHLNEEGPVSEEKYTELVNDLIENKVFNQQLNKYVQVDVDYQVNNYPNIYPLDLKDAIKDECRGLCELLNIRYTNQHKKLYHHWLSLHPPHIQELLLE